MSLFIITVKQRIGKNNTVLEKGMSVEVSGNTQSGIFSNAGWQVNDAFINKYGIDLKKLGGVGGIMQYFDVKKIS